MSWTPETVKEYVDREVDCLRHQLATALTTARVAQEREEQSLTHRLDNLNEWRQAYADLVAQKVDRMEADRTHQVLRDALDRMQRDVESMKGQAVGMDTGVNRLIPTVGIIIALGTALSALVMSYIRMHLGK